MSVTTSSQGPFLGQYYYNLEGYPDPNTTSNINNIYENIVGNGEKWFKLGVQAPAGTQLIINNKTIMVGRSGIYELDDNVTIETLKFIKPVKYTIDSVATNTALLEGAQEMQEALNKMKGLEPSEDLTGDQALYAEGQSAADEYSEAYNKYMQGINGIYKEESDASTDLKNIIIDYAYVNINTLVEEE